MRGVAEFWASRAERNSSTGQAVVIIPALTSLVQATGLVSIPELPSAVSDDPQYHIRGVMGPDEDHEAVDDNGYTNVAAGRSVGLAARLVRAGRCEGELPPAWLDIAANLNVPYDSKLDYHPQVS